MCYTLMRRHNLLLLLIISLRVQLNFKYTFVQHRIGPDFSKLQFHKYKFAYDIVTTFFIERRYDSRTSRMILSQKRDTKEPEQSSAKASVEKCTETANFTQNYSYRRHIQKVSISACPTFPASQTTTLTAPARPRPLADSKTRTTGSGATRRATS